MRTLIDPKPRGKYDERREQIHVCYSGIGDNIKTQGQGIKCGEAQIKRIKRYYTEGLSIGEIAKEEKLARPTVRRYVKTLKQYYAPR